MRAYCGLGWCLGGKIQPAVGQKMWCGACREAITDLSSVQMKPCDHRLCHFCAYKLSFGRDVLQDLCCSVRGCGRKVAKVSLSREVETAPAPPVTRKRKSDDDGEPEAPKERREETVVANHYVPHANYDPFRAIMRQWRATDAYREGGWREVMKDSGGYLFTAAWSVLPPANVGGNPNITFCKYLLSAAGMEIPSKDDVIGAQGHFGMLHSSLLPLSSQPREKKRKKKDDGDEDDNEDAEDDLPPVWTKRVKPLNDLHDHLKEHDHRVLPLLIHRLIRGNGDLEATNRATQPKQARLISHLISDLILRSINPQHEIGHVVDLLSYLFDHASQTEQHEVFSELRLLTSRTTSWKRTAEDTIVKLRSRYDINCRGLLVYTGDNLQWLLNRQGAYKHCYTNGYLDRPGEQLLEEGILYDEYANSPDEAEGIESSGAAGSNDVSEEADLADGRRRLSREPKMDWMSYVAEESEATVLDEIYRYRESDIGERGKLILTHTALVLQLDLPDIEECGRMERTGVYRRELPLLYRFDCPDKVSAFLAENQRRPSPESNDGGDRPKRMTIYAVSYTHLRAHET